MSKVHKIITPIIIILLIGGYILFEIYALIKARQLFVEVGNAIFLVIGVLVIIMILLIVTLFKRIKEIKDGEEDDLGKY